VLRRRLRGCDEVGWFDHRRLGVVLLDTPPDLAWKVAEAVVAACGDEAPTDREVYTYPSGAAGEPPPPEAGREPRRAGTGIPQTVGLTRPALRMETLFARPLPGWKRAIDIAGAALGLVVAAPVMLLVALAIKLSEPRHPVLFAQERTGLGGARFTIHKFRTMTPDAEARKGELLDANEQDGPAFKMVNDPRVTRLGRALRQTSIDELPQLWNVLMGDMSLVGPRPLPVPESNACATWQRRRLDVTPGITGPWQVEGRGVMSFVEWIRSDVRYIRSRSLLQDVKLLLLTLPAVVLRKGAN
jgi:lipopolysaccharide/colanic/teichoic acid biosynthesis glycosyltransferase